MKVIGPVSTGPIFFALGFHKPNAAAPSALRQSPGLRGRIPAVANLSHRAFFHRRLR
jgi:hypothetical protein